MYVAFDVTNGIWPGNCTGFGPEGDRQNELGCKTRQTASAVKDAAQHSPLSFWLHISQHCWSFRRLSCGNFRADFVSSKFHTVHMSGHQKQVLFESRTFCLPPVPEEKWLWSVSTRNVFKGKKLSIPVLLSLIQGGKKLNPTNQQM